MRLFARPACLPIRSFSSLSSLNLVPRAPRNTTCAACGTYDEISCALIASGYPYRVLRSLRWRPTRVGDGCLNHFLAQDRRRRGRAIELERPAALRNVGRIGLHLVDDLLLRLATADDLRKRYGAQCKSAFHNIPPRLRSDCHARPPKLPAEIWFNSNHVW